MKTQNNNSAVLTTVSNQNFSENQNQKQNQLTNSSIPKSMFNMKAQSIFSARHFFMVFVVTFFGMFLSQNSFAVETICKRKMCGHTYNEPTDKPNVLTGETQTIRVFVKFGDLVGAASAGVSGVTATIGAKQSGGVGDFSGCATWVDVNISVSSSAAEQNGVTISLFGVANTLTCSFKIDIRKNATISGISIKDNGVTPSFLVSGRTYQLTITGTNVNDLYVDDTKVESATAAAGATSTSKTFNTIFSTETQVNLTSIRFEESETFCHHDISKSITSIVLHPRPDILPDGLTGKYSVNGSASCGGSLGKVTSDNATLTTVKNAIGAPSTSQAVVVKEITWPSVQWKVKNAGGPISGTFKVQLKSGSTVLQEQTINGMNAGETKTFTYTRPKSKKKLMRSLSCNSGSDVHAHQDNATNPDYNWADPATFTIATDTQNTVTESNESNNNKGF
ncbi:hypothetical protein C7N43_27445 [Sphingobacteriales bacterium UPWRP_1]|nr:hypothetical protein BVG80_05295 [Sphingobacteriales bacterium TSM_CSM]PSJ73775.1 hypothetical protein C7N43_27445 [Sphingobacteriales bacterium UPWRP_1]